MRKWFVNEIRYFSFLDHNARRLIGAITIYNTIAPVLSIFINAFLWRESHNLVLIAVYNLFQYTATPFGFYLNGYLLKKITSQLLFFLGLLLMGMSVTTLIFLPHLQFASVCGFGFIFGLSSGIFWANRNLLTLQATKSKNRIYFASIESNTNTLTDIIIPALVGWFLLFGQKAHVYTPIQGYKMIALIMFLFTFCAGVFLVTMTFRRLSGQKLFLTKSSHSWNLFRLLECMLGFFGGINSFLPILIVLVIVGKEDSLGLIQSISALLSIIVISTIGKRFGVKHRVLMLTLSFTSGILGAVCLSVFYSPLGVILFFAALSFVNPFQWLATNSLNYDLIDRESLQNEKRYAFICDQELYLNGGRIAAIILFIVMLYFVPGSFALRFMPLFFVIPLFLLIPIARSIEKQL